jgi:hypothetical protein
MNYSARLEARLKEIAAKAASVSDAQKAWYTRLGLLLVVVVGFLYLRYLLAQRERELVMLRSEKERAENDARVLTIAAEAKKEQVDRDAVLLQANVQKEKAASFASQIEAVEQAVALQKKKVAAVTNWQQLNEIAGVK